MLDAAEVVRTMFTAVMAGDLAGVMAVISSDVEVIEPESLAYGGVHHGANAFRDDVFGAILGKVQLKVGRMELLGINDKVAASMDITFTSHATGQAITMPYVEIYTVMDGKVQRIDVYPQDTQRLVEFWNAN